jgi:ketosteroid isomerase-like protein
MSDTSLYNVAKRYFDAYNTVDTTTLEALLAEDVHWEHHNRFKGKGRAGLIESIKKIAESTPGRRFTEPTRWAAGDNLIYLEHQWHAIPATPNEMFGWKAGVPFSMDCASVFVVDHGKIIEWSDYG